jgi:uncharacterized membrane protein
LGFAEGWIYRRIKRGKRFEIWITDLEKRKIVSRKPHPAIPFVLGFVILALAFIVFSMSLILFSFIFLILGIFALVFAFIHWIVHRILNRK